MSCSVGKEDEKKSSNWQYVVAFLIVTCILEECQQAIENLFETL